LDILRTVEVDRVYAERGKCKGRTERGEDVFINLKRSSIDDGDVFQTDEGYIIVIKLKEENVLKFTLNDPVIAFKLGYAIGNYHLRVMLINNEVYILDMGEYLFEKFKEYSPKRDRIVFKPNLELPVSDVVISFDNT
jgi:urease accessory protein